MKKYTATLIKLKSYYNHVLYYGLLKIETVHTTSAFTNCRIYKPFSVPQCGCCCGNVAGNIGTLIANPAVCPSGPVLNLPLTQPVKLNGHRAMNK